MAVSHAAPLCPIGRTSRSGRASRSLPASAATTARRTMRREWLEPPGFCHLACRMTVCRKRSLTCFMRLDRVLGGSRYSTITSIIQYLAITGAVGALVLG